MDDISIDFRKVRMKPAATRIQPPELEPAVGWTER